MNIITKEQSEMIDLILAGHTITEIAKNHLRLHPSTLYRWMDKSEIKAELEERRRVLRKTARDRITGDVLEYIDNMKELANKCTDSRVRFNANKYLIDQCLGTATSVKEETTTTDAPKDTNDNSLKSELEEIKKLQVVK